MQIKNFILTIAALLLLSFPALAAKNVNIYDVVRETPKTKFYSETGKELTLSDFKGSFVVLINWSRDCSPCIRELDDLNEFYKIVKDHNIAVILISEDKEWSDVQEQKNFLKKYGAPDIPFYIDKKGRLAGALGIFSSPHTVLINSKGFEIGRIRGSADWDDPEVIEFIYKTKAENDQRVESEW